MHPTLNRSDTFSFLTLTSTGQDTVSLRLSADLFDRASVHETALSNLLPDLLLSGAGSYDRTGFLRAMNQLGGNLQLTMSDGVLHLTLLVGTHTYSKALGLVRTMLEAPSFTSSEFARAIASARNELAEALDDSRQQAVDALHRSCFSRYSRQYRPPLSQIKTALGKVTEADVQALYQRLQESFWYVSVAGPDSAHSTTERVLKRLRPAPTLRPLLLAQDQLAYERTLTLIDLPSRQNIDLAIGRPLPLTLDDPTFPAFAFGSHVLGKPGGFAGRLMQIVREKHGLTYGIYAQPAHATRTTTGLWQLRTFFHPSQVIVGLDATWTELRKLYARGITAHEHEQFQTILATSDILVRDSTHQYLKELHQYHRLDYNLEEQATFKESLRTVSRQAVNDAIKQYLDPTQLSVAGAGPIHAVQSEIDVWFARMA